MIRTGAFDSWIAWTNCSLPTSWRLIFRVKPRSLDLWAASTNDGTCWSLLSDTNWAYYLFLGLTGLSYHTCHFLNKKITHVTSGGQKMVSGPTPIRFGSRPSTEKDRWMGCPCRRTSSWALPSVSLNRGRGPVYTPFLHRIYYYEKTKFWSVGIHSTSG